MVKTISFKSLPENWIKEFNGLKSNTIRKCDNKKDVRFKVLNEFVEGKYFVLHIEIINTETKEMFYRVVTDVTQYGDLYIISWEHRYNI